jgi:hypothetical protein
MFLAVIMTSGFVIGLINAKLESIDADNLQKEMKNG